MMHFTYTFRYAFYACRFSMLVLLLILLPGRADAREMGADHPGISGQVRDARSGEALPGAHLQLSIAGHDEPPSHYVTDGDGMFHIPVAPSENLRLEVSFLGYASMRISLTQTRSHYVISLYPSASDLDAVVVTATRSSRHVLDIPIRMEVVGKERIEAVAAFSADDYLWSIPGVSISRGASFLGSATVSLRGMGQEAGRTLVLLDGVPVNKSDGGSVNWNAINYNDIEQIEVLKGPGSSIYGGNAMGGIIHLISPLPSARLQGNLSLGAGSFDTYNVHGSLSGRQDKFFWAINGRYRDSEGYITTPADEIDEYSVASFLDEYQLGGRVGYLISDRQMLELSGSWYDGKRGTGSNFTGFGFTNEDLAAPQGAYNRYSQSSGRINYRNESLSGAQWQIQLFRQRENYRNIRESVRNDVLSRYDVESIRTDLGLFSSYSMKTAGAHSLLAGIDLRHGAVDGADIYLSSSDQVLNQGKMNLLGLFLQDEIRLGDSRWSILAGLRFDYAAFYEGAFRVLDPTGETAFLQDFDGALDDASFSALSPRLSLQYHKPGDFRIYGGYSRGFRPPVLDDMCRTGRISGGMKLANPSLKPEYLDNIEIGADVFAGRRLTISPALFYARGTDYHAYIATGDSLLMNNRMRPIRIKDNIGKVSLMGAELSASWQIYRGISLTAAYSYTQTEILEHKVLDPGEDDDLKGKALVYQPRDLLQLALRWENPVVNVFVAYQYKGEQYINDVNSEIIDSFNYVDLHLWRRFMNRVNVSARVHNLFDQDFVDSRNMITPGRMFMLEVRYIF